MGAGFPFRESTMLCHHVTTVTDLKNMFHICILEWDLE